MNSINELRTLIQYYNSIIAPGIDAKNEKFILDSLRLLPQFSPFTQTGIVDELHRITINKRIFNGQNKRIRDIKLLKYPPADLVSKYGRCNYPKQSVLYASMGRLISAGEMRPEMGDLITYSHWKVKEDQPLLYFPIFKNQPKETVNVNILKIEREYDRYMERYPPKLKEGHDIILQFIADYFSKKVSPDNHFDYLVSAYFSNLILNELNSGSIEAIYYPSVKNRLAFENLVIKPAVFDLKYELFEVRETVVTSDTSEGMVGGFGTCQCGKNDFEGDTIHWENHQTIYWPFLDLKKYDFS